MQMDYEDNDLLPINQREEMHETFIRRYLLASGLVLVITTPRFVAVDGKRGELAFRAGEQINPLDFIACCKKFGFDAVFPRFERTLYFDPDIRVILKADYDRSLGSASSGSVDVARDTTSPLSDSPQVESGAMAAGLAVVIVLVVVCLLGVAAFAAFRHWKAQEERSGAE